MMNREIKFRGKRKLNGEWVFGSLIIVGEDWCQIIPCGSDYDDIVTEMTRVISDTTSQFTGYKDKNANEIFEGDIIGDWTDVDGKMEQSKLTVYFDEMLGQWMLDNSSKQDKTISYSLFSELQDFEYEIIGNIYENPDLLPT